MPYLAFEDCKVCSQLLRTHIYIQTTRRLARDNIAHCAMCNWDKKSWNYCYAKATCYTWRRIILRRIHPLLKIRRATQTQKPCYSVMQCIRAAFANIFVANISAPVFGSDARNYSVAKILRHTVYLVMVHCTFVCCDLLWLSPNDNALYCTQTNTHKHTETYLPTCSPVCIYYWLSPLLQAECKLCIAWPNITESLLFVHTVCSFWEVHRLHEW